MMFFNHTTHKLNIYIINFLLFIFYKISLYVIVWLENNTKNIYDAHLSFVHIKKINTKNKKNVESEFIKGDNSIFVCENYNIFYYVYPKEMSKEGNTRRIYPRTILHLYFHMCER